MKINCHVSNQTKLLRRCKLNKIIYIFAKQLCKDNRRHFQQMKTVFYVPDIPLFSFNISRYSYKDNFVDIVGLGVER